MTMPDTRIANARQRTGETTILPVHTQLAVLRERGILVDVNITGTNLFKKSLSWLESGIDDRKADDRLRYFTKGQKYVWDEGQVKELVSVVTQMRQLLADTTFRVTGFYPYRYMPFTAHARFVSRWQVLSTRFNAIKQSMIEGRDRVVDALASEYASMAANIFNALTAPKRAKYIAVHFKNGDTRSFDETEFVSFIVENTVASIPTAEVIADRLTADYVVGLLYTDADIQTTASLSRVNRDMLTGTGDSRVTNMLQHEAQRSQANAARTPSPFLEVFSALREEIIEAAKDIRATINKSGKVHGKVSKKAKGLLDIFDLKAAHSDHELRDLLVALKVIANAEGTPAADALRAALDDVINLKAGKMESNAFAAVELD